MLGFFNTETLSREDVIYAVITGAPLHQPLKRVSTNPHCCPSAEMFWPKKMFILLFLRVSWRQAPPFPTSPAGCPEKNQKELVERGGFHHGLTQSMATAPVEELIASGTALLLLEGNTGFEERIKEDLILALHLGELISQKYFLGAHANQCLGHVLCKGHGKSQAPGES